jgi:LPXTG-site transpeptidase (sortase) family protein
MRSTTSPTTAHQKLKYPVYKQYTGKVKLSRINTFLVVGIILVNGLTIGLPFGAALLFKLHAHGPQKQQLEHRLAATTPAVSAQNSLIMPSALFDQAVFDGPDLRTLRKGVWHRPASSSPDKGGNTVFAAHRFTYSNPQGAFYHLDKVSVGDAIGVTWEGKLYRYRVSEVRVVGPNETSIEAPTATPQLTLYTCTPLALPKNRLVVIAKPEVPHE